MFRNFCLTLVSILAIQSTASACIPARLNLNGMDTLSGAGFSSDTKEGVQYISSKEFQELYPNGADVSDANGKITHRIEVVSFKGDSAMNNKYNYISTTWAISVAKAGIPRTKIIKINTNYLGNGAATRSLKAPEAKVDATLGCGGSAADVADLLK